MTMHQTLFSLHGRIGRRVFWVCTVTIWVLNLILAAAAGYQSDDGLFIVLLVWLTLTAYVTLAVCAKRCHDIGRSGWFCLTTLIPMAGIGFFVWMGIAQSFPGENKHGLRLD